jgi:hypothetical protein
VIDSEKPDRIVAKLSSNPPQRGNPSADRYGVFLLIDSEGKELCGVTNNQLIVSRIACNSVAVLDPQDPNRVLALLSAREAAKPNGAARRLGSLLLTDSDGIEQFGIADDQLSMRQIVCEGVAVVNPENRGQVLAALGSVAAKPAGRNAKTERFGVLALNNEQFGSLHGVPPQRPLESQPPQDSAPEADQNARRGADSDHNEGPATDPPGARDDDATPSEAPAPAGKPEGDQP